MACELSKDAGDFPNSTVEIPHTGGARNKSPAIYRTAARIFSDYRSCFNGGDKTESEITEELTDAALLVIDEISKRGETKFEDQRITAIIDARYAQDRATLLLGNFASTSELVAALDSSVISRMQECGGIIQCDWPSFRATAQKP
ncbi:MAG: hypothetical protein E6R03_02440 [Hyphomicrobiaceae bacterium]|nr:MAG: hypothetical protein E6R03_02440 [Hyphomicrobiaceae bacterium]